MRLVCVPRRLPSRSDFHFTQPLRGRNPCLDCYVSNRTIIYRIRLIFYNAMYLAIYMLVSLKLFCSFDTVLFNFPTIPAPNNLSTAIISCNVVSEFPITN